MPETNKTAAKTPVVSGLLSQTISEQKRPCSLGEPHRGDGSFAALGRERHPVNLTQVAVPNTGKHVAALSW